MAEPLAALGQSADPSALAYRSALLPLGRTNAGSLTWAVPQAVLSALGAVQYPGQVYRGEASVFDPASGHVSDEAVGKAFDIAGTAMTGGLGGMAKQAGETALGAGPIRAFHGSPHSFDRFELSKIGTGEGAQMYGHGLYFAENEAVAKSYRDNLSPMRFKSNGAPITDDVGLLLAESKARYGLDLNDTIANLSRDLEGKSPHLDDPVTQQMRQYLARAKELQSANVEAVPTGHMYEVAIKADPARMLDYDAPLTQQSAKVQRFAKRAGVPAESLQDLPADPANGIYRGGWGSGPTRGGDLIEYLTRRGYDPAEVSSDLRKAGVPGLRYFDEGSRTNLAGTRNYVTFSDDVVSILRKYGLAGAIGAGGALGALGNSDVAQAGPQAPLSALGR